MDLGKVVELMMVISFVQSEAEAVDVTDGTTTAVVRDEEVLVSQEIVSSTDNVIDTLRHGEVDSTKKVDAHGRFEVEGILLFTQLASHLFLMQRSDRKL